MAEAEAAAAMMEEGDDIEDSKPAARERDEESDPGRSSDNSQDGSKSPIQPESVRENVLINDARAAIAAANDATHRYSQGHRHHNIRESGQVSANREGAVLHHNELQAQEGVAVAAPFNRTWAPGTVSAQRQRRWADLIYERPSMRSNDEMTQWLLSVMQVSDPTTASPKSSSAEGESAQRGSGRNNPEPQTATASADNGQSSSSSSSRQDHARGRSRNIAQGKHSNAASGEHHPSPSSSSQSDENTDEEIEKSDGFCPPSRKKRKR